MRKRNETTRVKKKHKVLITGEKGMDTLPENTFYRSKDTGINIEWSTRYGGGVFFLPFVFFTNNPSIFYVFVPERIFIVRNLILCTSKFTLKRQGRVLPRDQEIMTYGRKKQQRQFKGVGKWLKRYWTSWSR